MAAAARSDDGKTPSARGAGALIALEGVDGCGKSTQAGRLVATLAGAGIEVGPLGRPGAVVREPGGTPLGEGVRDLLLHRDHDVGPWTEALLYAAARSQLADEVLRPALAAGRVVVLDRYVDSSLAYQGHARGLGIDEVLAVNMEATGGLLPDLAVVLAVPAQVLATRPTGSPDRIEAEGERLQELVAEGYTELAARFPARIRMVDGCGTVEEVAGRVADTVMQELRRRSAAPPLGERDAAAGWRSPHGPSAGS